MKRSIEDKIAHHVFTSLKNSTSTEEEAHILTSLVKILEEKNALSQGERIMYALKNLFDRELGIIKAHIIVQERLSPQIKNEIKDMLKKKYNAQDVVLVENIDERIMGGIKIKVGEEVYDATLKTSLFKLKDTLK